MFDLQQLVRNNILDLEPYSSARSEYGGTDGIFLDANENPFGQLNRYPDPGQQILRQRLSELKGISAKNLFIGNGSDEIIDLVFRIFCKPGVDKALTFTPTYGMYKVAAAINDVTLLEVPLNDDFQIGKGSLEQVWKEENLKAVIVCSPNNPTGNIIESIDELLQKFKGIVLVDEAYIDFADSPSFISQLSLYPNLIVTQTLSKAWGLAGARIGIAYASRDILHYFVKTKPPYNVSQPDQDAALAALSDVEKYRANLDILTQQREWLKTQLPIIPIVKKVYPSDANFLLVATIDANYVYQQLRAQNIIVRNRDKDVRGCIRLTVGTPEQNRKLIAALQNIQPPSDKKAS